jgi:spermidine synthase
VSRSIPSVPAWPRTEGEIHRLHDESPELVPHLNPGVLGDPRTRLIHDDVVRVIAREKALDLILLDVDNGPEWASFRSNSRLYGERGLREARQALRPGGHYAVWSGYPVDGFLKHLRSAGFAASVIPFYEKRRLQARAYVGRKR